MIKLKKHYVTNGKIKSRVKYSLSVNTKCKAGITIYAKDFDDSLKLIFKGVKNDTDTLVDYYEKDRINLYPEDELYEQARLYAK